MVVVERYPDLKANQNFLELQTQLEGTENRISNERRIFIELTRDYNTNIRRFPKNIYASMFGFERKPTFESRPGSDVPPVIEF
jgi:LemA protein